MTTDTGTTDTQGTETQGAEDTAATETKELQGELIDGDGNTVDVDDVIADKDTKPDDKKADEPARPEWLPEKFKQPEDLVKSYTELEKTLKEKGKVAPDEYTIDDGEAIGIPADDELLKEFSGLAKEANLNNSQYNAVLKFAKDSGLIDAPDFDEEMKQLGPDAKQITESLARFGQTRLSAEEQDTLLSMSMTAKQVKLLHKMMRMGDKQIPVKPGEGSGDSRADLQKQLTTLLSDPNIRSDVVKKQEAEELSKRIASM